MDLLGMDVTWTAEFAEAGWIRELNPQQAAAATKDTLQPPIDTATWKDKLYGIPRTTNVQLFWYRTYLVPTPPKTFDEMMEMAQQLKDQGKTYEIGMTAAQYEGYVVNINNLVKAFGGQDRQRRQHRARDRRQDRAGAHAAPQVRDVRPHQLVPVQRAGARGVRRPAERALGVLPELALRPRAR